MTDRSSAAHFARRARGHDAAPVAAGTRPHVDQVVRLPHDRFVVLDHQHAVALILQVAQRIDQPLVVARMQADRGFVQHIADADQSGADAGGQPHALQFAATQRVGRPVERQVVDTDMVEEVESSRDLASQRIGDGAIGRAGIPVPRRNAVPPRRSGP